MVDRIVPIAEGYGDAEAVPLLLRRILAERLAAPHIRILKPIRHPRNRLLQGPDHRPIRSTIELAARIGGPGSGLLILMDGDDDCPRDLADRVGGIAREVRPDMPSRTVFAMREYEAWYLAAAPSLRAHRRVRDDAASPAKPEAIRDAKGHFQKSILKPGERYSPSIDQVSFTAAIDLEEASACRSFRKLEKDLRALIALPPPSNR